MAEKDIEFACAEINSITTVRIQTAQPTRLLMLGISAHCPENAGNSRPFAPETEPETPGIGAFGPAEEELSLLAN